ncbi:MAG TPA: hypothetical protein VMH86_15805 [Rhizomicrobium sp.]|nr:hypothetical protein [Rhizomicrobium sp.]
MPRLREKLGLPGNKLIGERWRARRAEPHPAPLFVFGNQKSGTTAVAGLLAAATGLSATLDFAGAAEPHIGRLYRGETSMADFVRANAWAFSNALVKEPSLTFVAPRVMDHFGVARAVFVIREPADNIRSILDRLKLRGDLDALDPARIDANLTWRRQLAGLDLGFPEDHYVATLARRWRAAAEVYRGAAERFVPMRYHEFRADRAGAVAALAARLGLPVTADIGAVLDRDFQRRGTPRDAREFFGAKNLARIVNTCGEVAAELGFEIPG